MFYKSRESPTQVFCFLLHNFEKTPDRFRFVGYDRSCELEPFLRNLSAGGNPGALLLLQKLDFLVDIFHIMKHVRDECNIKSSACRYDPRLDRFQDIHGANTESAEQIFSWLLKFKHSTRKMAMYKFMVFLHIIFDTKNHVTENNLRARKMM